MIGHLTQPGPESPIRRPGSISRGHLVLTVIYKIIK